MGFELLSAPLLELLPLGEIIVSKVCADQRRLHPDARAYAT